MGKMSRKMIPCEESQLDAARKESGSVQQTRRAHLLGEVGVDPEDRLEVCDVGHGTVKLFRREREQEGARVVERELLAKDK
jgi:hypothetical protein